MEYQIDERILNIFINFYGEEYREYITEKFSNLQIIWYDDKPYNEGEDIKKHFITNVPEDKLDEYLSSKNKNVFLQSAYIDELELLVLPQNGDLTQIIHELNHMISGHIISLEPLNIINGISLIIERNNGIMKINEFLNETINHMMTLEMVNAINVTKTPSWQEKMFPIVKFFYETFKSDLKELYINGDLSNFISKVGQENFDDFSNMMYIKGFKIRRSIRKGEEPQITEEDITKINEIVSRMQNHYKQTISTHKK